MDMESDMSDDDMGMRSARKKSPSSILLSRGGTGVAKKRSEKE